MTDDYIDTPFGKIRVAPEEECEKADYVVCGKPGFSLFEDDIHTTCSKCGAEIIHRPYAPVKPPKICLECLFVHIEKEKSKTEEKANGL